MTTLLEDLRDLHKQATTERSHHYVAATCLRAITEITDLQERLVDLEDEFKEMTLAFAKLLTNAEHVSK